MIKSDLLFLHFFREIAWAISHERRPQFAWKWYLLDLDFQIISRKSDIVTWKLPINRKVICCHQFEERCVNIVQQIKLRDVYHQSAARDSEWELLVHMCASRHASLAVWKVITLCHVLFTDKISWLTILLTETHMRYVRSKALRSRYIKRGSRNHLGGSWQVLQCEKRICSISVSCMSSVNKVGANPLEE